MTWAESLIVLAVVLFLVRLWQEVDRVLSFRRRLDPTTPDREKERPRA